MPMMFTVVIEQKLGIVRHQTRILWTVSLNLIKTNLSFHAVSFYVEMHLRVKISEANNRELWIGQRCLW